jgi:hypothetical protein
MLCYEAFEMPPSEAAPPTPIPKAYEGIWVSREFELVRLYGPFKEPMIHK